MTQVMIDSKKPSGGVARDHGRSDLQKAAFWGLHLLALLICAWLLLGGGLVRVGAFFGQRWVIVSPVRATWMLGCVAIYVLRHGFGIFFLIRRKVTWGEALGLGFFLIPVEIAYCVLATGVANEGVRPLGWIEGVALALVLLGSYLNTASELQRHRWKAHPENKGKIYTQGLFGLSMHINYLGDSLWALGWTILSASWWMVWFPLLVTAGFIFVHIPALDAYLAERYGEAFARYAARTRKFIPYVY